MGISTASGLTRGMLLRRGAAGGVALVAAGSLASAALGAAPPDGDLAALRLLIGAELLALDFQAQALASGKLGTRATATFKRMRADEQAHCNGLATLLSEADQTPATADDIDFAYPRGTFTKEAAIIKAATELEALQLGAYVGANAGVQTPALRLAIAQISANEAQHAAALAALAGKPVIGKPFGPALDAAAVTTMLNAYES
ncbi:MAG TPA: ferritin-like domain-containing protein [Gaiellaceae bacterium]|nr:ferritin-like domain-containing protein [Gaiellaceae bacterium]